MFPRPLEQCWSACPATLLIPFIRLLVLERIFFLTAQKLSKLHPGSYSQQLPSKSTATWVMLALAYLPTTTCIRYQNAFNLDISSLPLTIELTPNYKIEIHSVIQKITSVPILSFPKKPLNEELILLHDFHCNLAFSPTNCFATDTMINMRRSYTVCADYMTDATFCLAGGTGCAYLCVKGSPHPVYEVSEIITNQCYINYINSGRKEQIVLDGHFQLDDSVEITSTGGCPNYPTALISEESDGTRNYFLKSDLLASNMISEPALYFQKDEWHLTKQKFQVSLKSEKWDVNYPKPLDMSSFNKVATEHKAPLNTLVIFVSTTFPIKDKLLPVGNNVPCKSVVAKSITLYVTVTKLFLKVDLPSSISCDLPYSSSGSTYIAKFREGVAFLPYVSYVTLAGKTWRDVVHRSSKYHVLTRDSFQKEETLPSVNSFFKDVSDGASNFYKSIVTWTTERISAFERFLCYILIIFIVFNFPSLLFSKIGIIGIIISVLYVQFSFSNALQIDPPMIEFAEGIAYDMIATYCVFCRPTVTILAFTIYHLYRTRSKSFKFMLMVVVKYNLVLCKRKSVLYVSFAGYILLRIVETEVLERMYEKLSDIVDYNSSIVVFPYNKIKAFFSRIASKTALKSNISFGIKRGSNPFTSSLFKRASVIKSRSVYHRTHLRKNVRNLENLFFHPSEFTLLKPLLSILTESDLESIYSSCVTIASRPEFDFSLLEKKISRNLKRNIDKCILESAYHYLD